MSLSGFLPAVSRRAVVICSVAVFACVWEGAPLRAQAQQPAPAQADPLTFKDADSRLVFIQATPDAATALQDALAKAKDVLAKTDKAERKEQAAHWKVLRNDGADGSVTLIYVLDKTVPNVSYNPFAILYEAGLPRDQVDPILAKVNTPGALKSISPVSYKATLDMGGAGGGH